MEKHKDVCEVILFESEQEMDEWLRNSDNVAQLKQTYDPKKHRCLCNKRGLQVTILKGRE